MGEKMIGLKQNYRKTKFWALLLSLIMTINLVVPVAADSTVDWDGKAELLSNTTYVISEDLTIDEDLTIPQNCILYVEDDAIITISEGATLTIRGELMLRSDAIIRCYGHINAVRNSSMLIMGKLIIRENATLATNGILHIYNTGFLNVYGSFSTGSATDAAFNGIVFFREDSEININSDVRINKKGHVEVYHDFTIKENVTFTINGSMNVRSTAAVTLYGNISITEEGELSGFGTINRTKFLSIDNNGTITVTLKTPEPVEINGLTYVGEVLLVNKTYGVPANYDPGLQASTFEAFNKMYIDAKKAGFDLEIISGYRSYSTQQTAFTYWNNYYGKEYASTISARPGHSEHQTGFALDISSLQESYGNTAEGRWLAENCWKYGFIIRYPYNKTAITGYRYEPWHVRYLGTEIAAMVHESGLCLEEFLGVS